MNSALDGTHNPSQTPFLVWVYLVLELWKCKVPEQYSPTAAANNITQATDEKRCRSSRSFYSPCRGYGEQPHRHANPR
ncbi:unnamed protein product [Laminaria digitata]